MKGAALGTIMAAIMTHHITKMRVE